MFHNKQILLLSVDDDGFLVKKKIIRDKKQENLTLFDCSLVNGCPLDVVDSENQRQNIAVMKINFIFFVFFRCCC